MRKPNYAHQRRQRQLDKQAKKEAKRLDKFARKEAAASESPAEPKE